MTDQQLATLNRKWEQSSVVNTAKTLGQFIDSSEVVLGGSGAIAVEWLGMWLCIETDGYCHT